MKPMFKPRVILHPTDFSPSSEYAFHIAVDLAKEHGANLLVLHVVETLGAGNLTYGEAISQVQPEGYQRRLWDDFRRRIPAVPAAVTVEPLLAEGEPAKEIDRVAREQHCDLIVMGTHGRTGLDHLLMGSVAERVVRQVPCPVLVVKASPAGSNAN
jgi:nucleotide-binding universal stress UspA family protein